MKEPFAGGGGQPPAKYNPRSACSEADQNEPPAWPLLPQAGYTSPWYGAPQLLLNWSTPSISSHTNLRSGRAGMTKKEPQQQHEALTSPLVQHAH
jgi:hypothetical protein